MRVFRSFFNNPGRSAAIILAILDTMFVFGLIVFLYVVGVSYFQPYWLSKQVFHLQEGVWWLGWLRNDTIGVIGFVLSVAGFFAGRYLKNLKRIQGSS